MKGYRFYEEFESNAKKRARRGKESVIALILDDRNRPLWNGSTYDCIGAVHDLPNSGVATTGVQPEYLRKNCRRITEAEARKIHPRLMAWLDSP